MAGYRHWTHDRCIAAVREHVSEHGRIPRAIDWKRAAPSHPCQSTFVIRFGTWNNGIRAAGFAPHEPWNTTPRYWSRARVIFAIRAWATSHGRPPRTRDWFHAAPEHPNAVTVRRVCGSFNAAVRTAGFIPFPARRPRAGLRAGEDRSAPQTEPLGDAPPSLVSPAQNPDEVAA